MKTSMNIPKELVEEAKKLGNTTTQTQAVILALHEFVQKRKAQKLTELKGTLANDYDYKKQRKKR